MGTSEYALIRYVEVSHEKTTNPNNIHFTLNVACAASITAYARMKMSNFLIENEVLYMDTDCLFIRNKLESNVVSSSLLGYFKFEAFVMEGIFLEPKTYALVLAEDLKVIKAKGVGLKDYESIKRSYFLNESTTSIVTLPFIRLFHNLSIFSREMKVTDKASFNKRIKIFDENGRWIDTRPIVLNEPKDAYLIEMLNKRADKDSNI